jgi:hypothetical protein
MNKTTRAFYLYIEARGKILYPIKTTSSYHLTKNTLTSVVRGIKARLKLSWTFLKKNLTELSTPQKL